MLSYDIISAGPVPTVGDPDGLYPYESYVQTAKRPRLKTYAMVEFENDHLTVAFCPDLGGKV